MEQALAELSRAGETHALTQDQVLLKTLQELSTVILAKTKVSILRSVPLFGLRIFLPRLWLTCLHFPYADAESRKRCARSRV